MVNVIINKEFRKSCSPSFVCVIPFTVPSTFDSVSAYASNKAFCCDDRWLNTQTTKVTCLISKQRKSKWKSFGKNIIDVNTSILHHKPINITILLCITSQTISHVWTNGSMFLKLFHCFHLTNGQHITLVEQNVSRKCETKMIVSFQWVKKLEIKLG